MKDKDVVSIVEEMVKVGKEYMSKLSLLPTQTLREFCEQIYEFSYDFEDDYLSEEYKKSRKLYVEYDNNGLLNSIELKWSYYDSSGIKIDCMGIEYWTKKEHGPKETIMKMSWLIFDKLSLICNDKLNLNL
jgi:hypothetical protein